MMQLDEALVGITTLGFDTSPFINFIERHPAYVDIMREIILHVDEGNEKDGFSMFLRYRYALHQTDR
jgi:hypothetical protein